MHIQSIDGAPANERGGQKSYLLLTEGQFGSKNLAITWVEGAPGSMQAVHGHPDNEQIYVIVRGRGVMQVEQLAPGRLFALAAARQQVRFSIPAYAGSDTN